MEKEKNSKIGKKMKNQHKLAEKKKDSETMIEKIDEAKMKNEKKKKIIKKASIICEKNIVIDQIEKEGLEEPICTVLRKRRDINSVLEKNEIYDIDNSNVSSGLPPIVSFHLEDAKAFKKTLSIEKDEDKIKVIEKKKEEKDKSKIEKTLKNVDEISPLYDEMAIRVAVLELLNQNEYAMSKKNIAKCVNASPAILLDSTLLEMLELGEIFFDKKRRYALPKHLGYLTGRLQVTTRGFGFLIPDDESEDIFIAQDKIHGALNGDHVIIKILDFDGSQSREGEIVFIQEHFNTQIVGTIKKVGAQFIVVPDNSKLGITFPVQKGHLKSAKSGQKIVAYVDYDNGEPSLRIREILGYPEDPGTDVLSIIREHDIPEKFPPHVLSAAQNISQEISQDDISRREDLRNLTIVTIDGADSKDFDDAVSCERLNNGNYMLGVHIADVAHYIKENSALDKEAYRRGNSVYFIDRVIPMLPETISNGICSLNPKVDRLTLSCFMEVDKKGIVISHRISESVICSAERLVYEDISAFIEGNVKQKERYNHIASMIDNMRDLTLILQKKRNIRGSLNFDIPESRIQVDNNGKPIAIDYYERGFANQLIEEFMLCCNETIAAHVSRLSMPMLYRVHEMPEADKIGELNLFLGSLGYSLRNIRNGLKPKSVQAILQAAKGKPEESILSRVVLRSLKKARYCEQSLGHFGLAADYYCHFTSPIRRYPDLKVHRIIKEVLHSNLNDKRLKNLKETLPEIAAHCSERERVAMEAERDVDDLKKAEYLSEHVGEAFDGVVSGVTSFGLFVVLPNSCEGMIRISEIKDDYYSYDEKNYRIIGRNTHKIYRLGDSIKISISSVDLVSRRVDFDILLGKSKKQQFFKTRKARKK